MKKIQMIFPAIILAILSGCGGGAGTGNNNIQGTFTGAEGNTAYFQRFEMGVPVNVDSTVISEDGSASFSASDLKLDFYQIDLGTNRSILLILDEGDNPVITSNVNDILSIEVEGSEQSRLYYDFMAKMKEFELDKERVRNELRADQGNASLTQEYNGINEQHYKYITDIIDANPGSPMGLAALASLNVEKDMDRFKLVRDAMAETMPHSGFYTQLAQNIDLAEQQAALREKQMAQQKKSESLLAVGSEAPDFAQARPDGSVMKLSDLRGKVVLIDFWASWCKPCRRENPSVVKAYNKFKSKGFEIIGVSLDKDRGRWLQAVEQDGLTWPQVSDLAFWQNAVALQYGVRSIPFTVLVDQEGKVLATKLRGPALEKKLEELLGA